VNVALKKIKPVWIVFAVAGVVITAAGLVHLKVLSSRGNDLAALEADIHRTAQANIDAERLIRDLPELRAAARRFALEVPPEQGPLLESIGADLTADGAPEREIMTKPTVAGQPVARVPFSLQYRGTFAGTVSLLNRLQDGERLTRVERIVVERSATGDANDRKTLRVQVDFSTFARTAKELEQWAQLPQ
jgi:hypothetical protein